MFLNFNKTIFDRIKALMNYILVKPSILVELHLFDHFQGKRQSPKAEIKIILEMLILVIINYFILYI